MFVDIAGFTTLSERLAQLGTAGTEQLGVILRRALGGGMDAVAAAGGDTLSFGGDAIVAAFPAGVDDAWDRAHAVGEQIVALVASLNGTETLIGPLALSVKVGISSGSVTSLVSSSGERSTVVHLGAGLDAAVAAEEEATPGTIVVRRTEGASRADPLETTATSSAEAIARRTVPPIIAARIDQGVGLRDEHRRATVVFASLPPVLDGDAAGLSRLAELVASAQELMAELGGELIHCVGGDKGLVLVGAFGMLVSRADDPTRAVAFIERLRARAEVPITAGVSTGLVWVGLISGARRAFVGIIADSVNRGARLMGAAAANTTLVEEQTRAAAGWAIETTDERLISVKGKSLPVLVHQVAAVTGRVGSFIAGGTPMVGRDAVVDGLVDLVGGCRDGAGTIVQIIGPAGSGKTRVAATVARRLEVTSVAVERGRFDGYGMGQPYGPFQDVIRARLGLGAAVDRAQLDEALATHLPAEARSAPLLAQVLGVAGEENAFTLALPLSERSELTRSAVIALLQATTTPTVLVLEDVHWADEASDALLASLAESNARSLLTVLTTRRPVEDGRSVVAGTVVELEALDDDALAAIVGDTWLLLGGAPLDREIVAQIVARAAGNPLVAAVTCQLVRRDWAPGLPIPAVPLFEELLGVFTEQVDGLPAPSRDLALRCAVVGRAIDPHDLADVFDLDPRAVTAGLEGLAAGGFLVQQADGYRLRHSSLGDVLRESTSHADREPLHRSVARWLLARHGPPREIAVHLEHCPSEPGRVSQFRAARDGARTTWNLREAFRWSEQCLADPDHDIADLLAAAEIGLALGRYAAATRALEEVDAPSERNLPSMARRDLAVLRGRLALETGHPEDGVEQLYDAERLGSSRPELSWPLTMALCDLGRFAEAEERARRRLDDPDPRVQLDSLANLGVALVRRGDLAGAKEAMERSAALAEELGDLMRLVHATGDLAGVHFETGDLVTSIRLLERAAALAQRLGAHRALTMALGNQAQVRLASGDLAGAQRVAAASVRAALILPDPGLSLLFIETPVVIAESLGEVDDALRWWNRHAALERRLGRRHEAAISMLRAAALLGRSGARVQAQQGVDEASQILATIDPSEDATLHLDRALLAISGGYEPPPEVVGDGGVPTTEAPVVIADLDGSIPEVGAVDIDELFARIERLVAPAEVAVG